MLNQQELEALDELEQTTPARDRLRQLLHDRIYGEGYTPQEIEDGILDLTTALEYQRDTVVRMWLTGRASLPLEKLQGISDALFIPLPTLLAAWVAKYAPEDLADHFWNALRPRITEQEFELIEKSRKVYVPPEEENGEDGED